MKALYGEHFLSCVHCIKQADNTPWLEFRSVNHTPLPVVTSGEGWKKLASPMRAYLLVVSADLGVYRAGGIVKLSWRKSHQLLFFQKSNPLSPK